MGHDIQNTTPLDRMVVTDHSEYARVVRLAYDPSSSISKLPVAERLVVHDTADIRKISLWLGDSLIEGKPIADRAIARINASWRTATYFAGAGGRMH